VPPPIRKLLVANRGEIAARIFRTCDRLGIATVAVYAPDDAGALHVRRAADSYPVGSYLYSEDVIRAALASGADAVHPGYGFLAESARFAAAVEAAGLVWVGPPPAALEASGDKLAARRLAAEADVPVLPAGTAEETGFPLVVKAAAGGGGRGMRLVRGPDGLGPALEAAAREAGAAFGDGTVYCERYLERPRHVEVQILADGHGTVLALGERECSIQRRHQKVLEETPSPAVDEALRARLCEAATAVARGAAYASAGTVEFLLDGKSFWFLELNARVQVEHPVTELVTGCDIVEQQLRIAAGKRLGSAPASEGHAVEARLYAEHPLTFLPQSGRVSRLRLPADVRVDAGVEEGDDVPVAYDPLLAKLVALGETRDEALAALARALADTDVRGVTTNLPFLRWLVSHPVLCAGDTTTAFLAEQPPLSRYPRPAGPWRGGWRLNAPAAPAAPPPVLETSAHAAPSPGADRGEVRAPMPGVVLRVLAGEGEPVAARDPLVVLEAMKMETPLVAPYDGVVLRVHVAEGDRVGGGALLVELA
jgi:acetyl/propionyl-CoA carboxylase alpha subunit